MNEHVRVCCIALKNVLEGDSVEAILEAFKLVDPEYRGLEHVFAAGIRWRERQGGRRPMSGLTIDAAAKNWLDGKGFSDHNNSK